MATLSDIPALRLGRLFGIPILVDATFLLAIVTIFFGVMHRQFPSVADRGMVVLLVTAGVFLSILTHELGHALVARRFGLYADEIRIGGFYGLAILSGSPPRRTDSILILLAGPLANTINSILLLIALGMPALTGSLYLGEPMFASPITDIPVLRVSLQWLAYVNVGMVIFNLMPAFPLDGGRIARLLLGNVLADAVAVRIIAGLGVFMGVWSVFGIVSYPALLLAGPMLVLANYSIWQGELAAPAD
jgi:Zn-dependent protease